MFISIYYDSDLNAFSVKDNNFYILFTIDNVSYINLNSKIIDGILNQPFEYDYINYTDSYNQECLLTCNLELNEDSIRDVFKSLKDKFPEYLL